MEGRGYLSSRNLSDFDSLLVSAFQSVTGVALSAEMVSQLRLPLAMGGFDVGSRPIVLVII